MISAIFFLFGVGGWLVFIKARQKVARIHAWPVVTATIIESRVTRQSLKSSLGGVKYMYSPWVRYGYEVQGVTRQNDTLDPVGAASTNRAQAEETVRKYSPGSSHDLHFNPLRPQEAYLECKNSPALFAIIGSVFIATGVIIPFLK